MEIPCPTCPTWSHFIQDISIYLSLDKYKCIKLIQLCISYFDNYYQLTSCIENSVDPDQLASDLDLHCLQEKPADQDPYCLQGLIHIWFHTVFERINCLSTVRNLLRYKQICSLGQEFFFTIFTHLCKTETHRLKIKCQHNC